ncbi:MAG: hypothetical protein WA865_17520 [Spirulinaceae cyanobacterium]
MLKRIALICLFLTFGICGAFYYYWSQFTKIPQWYSEAEESALPTDAPTTQANKQQVQSKIASQIQPQIGNGEVEVKLNPEDVNELLVANIARNKKGSALLQTTKGVKTTIRDDSVEIGAVLNTAELSQQEAKIEQAIAKFPLLKNRDIYVAVEGQPTAINGQLQFDENTLIKVGNLSMTVTETAQRLGVSPDKLLCNLTVKSELIQVQDIKFGDEEIIFKGNRN